MAVETVDAHLGESAVLAVVFDAHSGLEAESVGQGVGADAGEELRCGDADERRTVAALGLALAAGDNDLIEHQGVGHHFEIDFGRGPGLDGDFAAHGLIAYEGHFESVGSRLQVAELIVT